MPSQSPQPASPREAESELTKPTERYADVKHSSDRASASPDEPRDNSNPASSSPESGEASSSESPASADDRENLAATNDAPPLLSEAPPLPAGPAPATEDDGWDFQWDPTTQAYFFYNRFTGASQWDNPRVPSASTSTAATAPPPAAAPGTTSTAAPLPSEAPPLPANDKPVAGGYNPAIHGDYDPNAWYAQGDKAPEADSETAALVEQGYGAIANFNRFTGQFQAAGEGPERHSDEAKSKRQMNAFFDVDAAANAHDGRSLKAERSGKKLSKSELKQFKEKRRARKEEKRRAWLRD
ncbi:WW domain-containing protein [Colletotrichum spinosum]|uniref:WW domain-containing protein n=1 Tax=Colletotrichum spinosum TaxID=1347390 RepID=A0A4R8Q1L3_9PEZI|nr:WW domain-containing protein [Colletotrichum spinosum]